MYERNDDHNELGWCLGSNSHTSWNQTFLPGKVNVLHGPLYVEMLSVGQRFTSLATSRVGKPEHYHGSHNVSAVR